MVPAFLASHWLSWLSGGGVALIGWFWLHIITKPLLEFWTDRRRAIEVVQRYGGGGEYASEERQRQALDAIAEVASKFSFYSRGGPMIVHTYCWFRRYDLAFAWLGLNGLRSKIATSSAVPADRCDCIRLCLGATGYMSAERKAEIRNMMSKAEKSD